MGVGNGRSMRLFQMMALFLRPNPSRRQALCFSCIHICVHYPITRGKTASHNILLNQIQLRVIISDSLGEKVSIAKYKVQANEKR